MPQLSLEQQADLASLAYELGHNPQTRAGMAQLVSRVNPNRYRASFPDVVQEQRFRALEARVNEKIEVNQAQAAKAKLDQQREGLKSRYSDDDIAKIEKVMDDSGVTSYDDAAVLYAHKTNATDFSHNGPPPQHERPGAHWEFPTVADRQGKPVEFKAFMRDPNKYAIDSAYNIISEFKNSKLSSGFRR